MALGRSKVQARFENPRRLLGDRLRGVYLLLAEHGGAMFGDDYFGDLYKCSRLGRPTIPARVLATVMLLQSHEGLSDQEACDRLEVGRGDAALPRMTPRSPCRREYGG